MIFYKFYHWSINYVASMFHPIKIMIFHWQRINETNQCTWRCRRRSFRLTSNIHGSRSDEYINWDETVLLYEQLFEGKCASCMQWRSECSHDMWCDIRIVYKVNMLCFYFYFWVTINHWVWLDVSESPKSCTRRLTYTYHDDNGWAVSVDLPISNKLK